MVTGGCGFIGSHIVDKLLSEGYDVAVVDNLSTGNQENIKGKNVSFYQCDILSDDFFKVVADFHPDYIIHEAAQVSVSHSMSHLTYDTQVNILGSVNVIESAKQNNVKKIIFASSAAVYGEPEYLPIDLNHRTGPMSPYGLSKLTVEQYLKLAKDIYGIEYTILRYANVYGPRQDANGEGGVVAIFSDKIVANVVPTIFGDGEQTRDFIFVKDVAAANVKALENGNSMILNVSSGEKISVNELFAAMNKIGQKDIQAKYVEVREGDIRHSLLDNTLTKENLNWKPSYSLEEGLKETLEFYIKE